MANLRIALSGAELDRAAGWLAGVAMGQTVRNELGRDYLGGILIDATGDAVRMESTNLQTFATARPSGAIVYAPGRAVVSARLLALIASACARDETVTFDDCNGKMDIHGNGSSWQMPVMVPDRWPGFPAVGEWRCTVDAPDFDLAVKRVMPAIDKEGLFPTWSGVALCVTADELTVATTDGYRMAACHIAAETRDMPVDCAVLGKELARALDGSDGATGVTVNVGDNTVTLAGRGFEASVRRLDDDFPNYRKAIPHPGSVENISAVVDTKALLAAIKRATMMANDDDPRSQPQLTIGEGEITVSAEGTRGTAHASCEADVVGPEGMTLVFRTGYLTAALSEMRTPFVELRIGVKNTRPVLFVPVNDERKPLDDYVHVVQPIDLNRVKAKA